MTDAASDHDAEIKFEIPAGSGSSDGDGFCGCYPGAPTAMTCSDSLASSNATVVAAPGYITGKHSDVDARYDMQESILGTGYNAEAVRVCVDRVTGLRHAVKSVRKTPEILTDLHREVKLLKEVDHDHVLEFVDVHEDAEFLHIVTNLYEGGELYDRISRARREKSNSHECDAARILRQVLSAVAYLHDRGIVHRDLKPENVLFETNEDDSPVRIIDFGLARKHYRDSFEPYMSTVVGSSYFLAPEVLRKKYDRSCDLWSVGVMAFIMLCGYPPFNGANEREVCEAVKRGKVHFHPLRWKGVSKEAKDFVRRLLRTNPHRRMTAAQALDHPWIRNHCAEGLVPERRRRLRLSVFRI